MWYTEKTHLCAKMPLPCMNSHNGALNINRFGEHQTHATIPLTINHEWLAVGMP